MAVDIGTARGYLDLDISKFTSALTQANAAASTQMKSMSQSFASGFNAAGKALTSAGKTMTTAVTAPIIALGTAAVKTTATFDSSMSKVQALSGATGEELGILREKAKEMGATTRYSASEAADALGYMALAGWDTEQMVSGLDGVLNLAAASEMELGAASDMVTDFLSAFGLEAKDAGKMADQMAYAQANSNTTTIQLGEAFKNSAANMASAGQTMETTTALLEAMANQGTKGSIAGTSLSAIMRDITKNMEDGAIAIGDTSIAVQDQDGNFRSLIDIMADVEKATDGMGTAQKTAALSSVFTAESIRGVNQVLMEGTDKIKGYEDALHGAGGTAEEMAAKMLDNLNGQLIILKSALEALAIQFGEILTPHIKQFVSWVQQLVEKFSALSVEEKEQIIKFALMAAAIGPVLLAFGKFLTSVATIVSFLGSISAPIAAIVAVIGVLVAAFATLWKTNEEFRNKMTAIWDGLRTKFEAFGQGIVEKLNALGFDFKNFAEVVSAVWKGFCELLAPVFEGVFNQIANILTTVLNIITGIFDVFIGIFTGNWEQAWTGVKEIFSAIWEFVKGTFESWAIAFRGIADTVLGWFGTNWETVWNKVKAFFANIWNGIKSFFSTVMNAIKTVATTVWTAISTFFTTIWNSIKTVITTTVNTIKTTISNVFNAIKTAITTILTAISTFFTTIWNGIKTTITTVVNAIKTIVNTAFNTIKTTITTVLNAISTFVTTIWNTIKSTITNVVNSVKSTISSVFNAIKTTITTIINAVRSSITTTWNNIKSTVTSVVNAIKTAISTAFTNMKSAVTTTIESLKTTVTNIFNGIKSAISGALESAKSSAMTAMSSAKNAIVNVWSGIKETFSGIGRNIIQGIINGIFGMVSSLYNSITNALSGLVNRAKSALGIASPSKVFEKEVGGWIPAGIAKGVEDKMGDATKDIQKSIDKSLSKVDAEIDPSVSVNDNVSNMVASLRAAYDGLAGWFESIEERIDKSINNMREQLTALIDQGQLVVNGNGTLDYVGYNGSIVTRAGSPPQPTSVTDASQRTYVFYSPKAIDEIEAAKQIKRTERDIAEGFM